MKDGQLVIHKSDAVSLLIIFSGPWYPYKQFTLYGLQQESSESMLRVTLLIDSSVSAAMIHTHILKKIVITKGRVFNKVRELVSRSVNTNRVKWWSQGNTLFKGYTLMLTFVPAYLATIYNDETMYPKYYFRYYLISGCIYLNV